MSNSLHQDKSWTGADGVAVDLALMSPRRRRNLLHFLRRRAESLELTDAMTQLADPFSMGEMAMEDEMSYLVTRDPHVWLETTPLVKRLAVYVAAAEMSGVNA